MNLKKKSARLLEQPNAPTPKGAINNLCGTSIVPRLWSAVKALTVTASAILWALLAATWALPAAWAERGYRGGFGGEWLLILAAGWFGGWLCWMCCKMAAEEEDK